LNVARLSEESREALASTGGVVANTTSRAITLLITGTVRLSNGDVLVKVVGEGYSRGIRAVGSTGSTLGSVCSSSVTHSTTTSIQRIEIGGALLERAISTTESNVALASEMLPRIPSLVVSLTKVSSNTVLFKTSSMSRASIRARGTSTSLTLVSREAVALTSGSVTDTLSSALSKGVGTVGITISVVTR